MSAGLYCSRGGLKTAILEKGMPGGMILLTAEIENYPGIRKLSGYELASSMEAQAREFGCEFISTEITGFTRNNDGFSVFTSENSFNCRSLIIASGSSYRKLGVPGEAKFTGNGVSMCATCDGAFFRNQEIAVIGGGNTACEEALFLTRFARKVYLVHRRDSFRAEHIVQKRLLSCEKITFVYNSTVEEICGSASIEKIRIRNVRTSEVSDLPVTGVFVFIGQIPNTQFLNNQLKLDTSGFIETDLDLKTSMNGVFAAGDVRVTSQRQVITAAGDGALAAKSAEHYLSSVNS